MCLESSNRFVKVLCLSLFFSKRMAPSPQVGICHHFASRASLFASFLAPCWAASSFLMVSLFVCALPNTPMTSHPTSSPLLKYLSVNHSLSILSIPSIHYQQNRMIKMCVLGNGGVGHVLFILHGDWLSLAWTPFGSAGPIRLIEKGR